MARTLASGSRPRPLRRGALPLLLATLAACTSAPPAGHVAKGQEGAPGVQGFLLCPANLVIALPTELEGGVEPVQNEIVAYLGMNGRGVERLALPEARALWQESVETAKSSGASFDFASTAQIFTRRLAEGRSFDAAVMPSLLLAHTRVRHRRASWDGVERSIRVVNMPHQSAGRNDNYTAGVIQGIGMSGDAPVSSLHVAVFSREGRQVFEGRGGLDFVEEIDLKNVLKTYRVDMHAREDLLQDPKILREGIEVAFTPYLRPPGR